MALLAVAWLLQHYADRFWYPPDDGSYANIAQRLLDGEVLNLHIEDVHPGYINFLNAAALRLFGLDLVSLRYPLVLAGLLQAVALFFVFPRERAWQGAVAAVVITALGAIQFLNPTAHWYCLALVCGLLAVLPRAPRSSAWVVVVGALIGTIVLFRHLTGFLVGLGTLTFLLCQLPDRTARGPQATAGRAVMVIMLAALVLYLVRASEPGGIALFGVWPIALLVRLLRQPQASNRAVIALCGRLAVGIGLAAVPLVGYHLAHGSLAAWITDIGPTALSLTRLEFIDRSNYPALVVFAARQLLPPRGVALALNGVYWTLLPLLAFVNGGLLVRLLQRADPRALAPLPFLAVFYAVVSVHFQIPIYLYYTVGLSLASVIWLMPGVSPRAEVLTMVAALMLAAIGVYYHAAQPSSRTILEMLHGDRRAQWVASALPHATLRIEPDEAVRYGRILDLIQRTVPAGETIFALPSNAELYFLSQRRNPFRFFNTALGVRSDADLEGVLRTLRERPPALVTFNPGDKYNTDRSRQIMDAVRARYRFVGQVEPFEVYVRP